ncbi:Probable chromosome-partitioning protein parB [Anaerotruncus sp. 2789STDY5834896]|uniref:Probable chromosome-partitioning protein parB n=1 Tax=uncultured Anaerotruncus sp. TaxID=905011 RepID=A0A1C6J2A7_9FIRM|nr:Probable chromosome-partitioning protein parB [uncultured Anaerotruncus sp.]
MAGKKRGLGKGLDALFVDNAVDSDSAVTALPVAEIEPHQGQPRRAFDQQALDELAASIAEHGVLQPILVRPLAGGGYQIVAGERRWRAARLAGLGQIPAVVREMTDEQVYQAALVENLQREDLNPVEESLGYQQLVQQYHMTQEQVAQKVSKSRSAVANALRLLSLPQPVIDLLAAGKLSTGHAKALLMIKDADTLCRAAEYVVQHELTVRQTERYCKQLEAGQKPRTEKLVAPIFKEVELSLTEMLGRRVKVTTDGKKGKLEIEYFSKDDLIQLAGIFNDKV